MKAVILAGGLGTRMREETEFRPKPMVEVGGRPVLWHIMKILATQGISDFVVCTGYKGEMIKDYFANYATRNMDFTVRLGKEPEFTFHGKHDEENWKVTVADTGPNTQTGGRLYGVRKYLEEERFLVTYGDGLANVKLSELEKLHTQAKSLVTVTSAKPRGRFGVLELDDKGKVLSFSEKPEGKEWVNIGYMMMEPDFLKYLNSDSVLEEEPLRRVAQEGQLSAHKHSGFWQPMDTLREAKILSDLWETGAAPWKIWAT